MACPPLIIGDVVTIGRQPRRMLVVDMDADRRHVVCAWRDHKRDRTYEIRFTTKVLTLRRRAPA